MAYTSINKPTDYFNTKLYTGNGSTQSITGVEFQPDWVWIKQRTGTEWHNLIDSVRGGTKVVYSNSSNAEATSSNLITSFDSDGFSIGNAAEVNANTNTFASWNWLAGGTASSNTDGSITSSVSANTTSGFSIVSYTGTGSASTIGHGLGSAPKMVICKTRSITGVWLTWHTGISINGQIQLQATDAVYNPGNNLYWNSTLPTSSVFSVGTSGSVNGSGTNYIAYCFAEKKGFSKFGSYTGNGSTNGPMVYTGFKPAFVILKITNSTNNWHMYDNKRDTYNVADAVLYPNLNNAEGTDTTLDFLSNGFKLKTSTNFANGSGDSYIYMAFAESPFTTSTGVPTTAR
jgi:hypothetical protein